MPATIRIHPRCLAERARARRGSMLLEFALISLAFFLLMAGTIEFGRAIASSQVIQNAARTAARELALIDLPATYTFEQALQDERVRRDIYDPRLLVVNVAGGEPDTSTWPVVNRMLLPVMVRQELTIDGETSTWLQYPGAVVRDFESGELTVAVPHVVARDGDGHETIQWFSVLEEVRSNAGDPASGPYSVASTGPQRLLVALRIHCPYQAASLTAMQPNDAAPGAPLTKPVLADDDAVTAINDAPGATVAAGGGSGVYAGPYGLGKFYAFGADGAGGVRPFRRLLSAQAVFRREVFR